MRESERGNDNKKAKENGTVREWERMTVCVCVFYGNYFLLSPACQLFFALLMSQTFCIHISLANNETLFKQKTDGYISIEKGSS